MAETSLSGSRKTNRRLRGWPGIGRSQNPLFVLWDQELTFRGQKVTFLAILGQKTLISCPLWYNLNRSARAKSDLFGQKWPEMALSGSRKTNQGLRGWPGIGRSQNPLFVLWDQELAFRGQKPTFFSPKWPLSPFPLQSVWRAPPHLSLSQKTSLPGCRSPLNISMAPFGGNWTPFWHSR